MSFAAKRLQTRLFTFQTRFAHTISHTTSCGSYSWRSQIAFQPSISLLLLAVIGISAWRLLKGFRTGIMQFGAGTINITCDRRNDPRGFWIYGVFNAFIGTLSIWGLLRVFGYI